MSINSTIKAIFKIFNNESKKQNSKYEFFKTGNGICLIASVASEANPEAQHLVMQLSFKTHVIFGMKCNKSQCISF